jgi:hypothetical protein
LLLRNVNIKNKKLKIKTQFRGLLDNCERLEVIKELENNRRSVASSRKQEEEEAGGVLSDEFAPEEFNQDKRIMCHCLCGDFLITANRP